MRHPIFLFIGFFLAESLAGQKPATVSWPQFRGPNGSGVAISDNPPIQFGPSEKLLWKSALPAGHSSPIVWDDHIFLTGIENERLVVLAVRRGDGQILWKQIIPTVAIEEVHPFSSAAASTPTTDGQRVYAYFPSLGLLAYDFDGKEIWRLPLPLPPTQYGGATSPIVLDAKVILQLDGNSSDSRLLAVNSRTGAVEWATARPLLRESWSTPTIWSHDGRNEIVTIGNGRLVAYSTDGVERWWSRGLTMQPIAVAVYGNGMLFASAHGTGAPSDPVDIPNWDALIKSYDVDKDASLAVTEMPEDVGILLRKEVPKETPGNYLTLRTVLSLSLVDGDQDGVVTRTEWDAFLTFMVANENNLMAIRPGGSGDSTESHVAWKANRGIPEIPSPIFYGGRLYLVRDGGMVTSYAPETGKIILDRQRLGAVGQYVASPVAADGRIYVASETGTVVVFRAGDTLEVLARNDLGESVRATPAIVDNKLYIRTDRHLWAFGN